MTQILHHPRLAFEEIGPEEEKIIRYYLDTGRPFSVVVGRDDVLAAITELERIRKVAADNLTQEVENARKQGRNWTVIAEALGISRSSAMARYVGKIEYVDLRNKDHPNRIKVSERIREYYGLPADPWNPKKATSE